MKMDILFSEKQYMGPKALHWFMYVMGIASLLFLTIHFIWGLDVVSQNENPKAMISVIAILPVITFFFSIIRLETIIDASGISVRMFPFQPRFILHEWKDIKRCYTRTYHPIAEYGGWGYRINFFGKGRALNTHGNKGIQIEFKDGKKLLIGTQKPEIAEKAIHLAFVKTS